MTGILFWNCRGASKLSSRAYLQQLVRSHHPIAILLLETRKQSFSRRDVDRLIGRHWSFEVIPSQGKSGGIVFLWLDDIISVSNVVKNPQFIIASILSPLGTVWQLAAVYASKYYHRRRIIWDELSKLDMSIPTIIGGDFNCVLRATEKRGGGGVNLNKGPLEFGNFITLCNLHETPFSGNSFTWCNNSSPTSRILSRLDRILLSSSALLSFPGSIVHHLPRIGSDHSPLLLEIDKLQFASAGRLKFEEVWLSTPNAFPVAQGTWKKAVNGSPGQILANKCARTIKALARWSRFSANAELRKAKEIEEAIKEMQLLEASRSLDDMELGTLRGLVANYNEIQARLETWWWQRAKTNWNTHGDRNSAFFHAAATQRKHENRIFSLRVGEETITDNSHIKDEFVRHFASRWTIDDSTPNDVLPTPPKTINTMMADSLLSPITDSEIKRAAFSFGRNKAPGFDGVTHTFFTHFWSFSFPEITAAIQDFFRIGRMEQSWKDTLIMLIPKCTGANRPDQFRPISLCSSIYKITSKIIVNRMKPLLRTLISEEQAAFVPGRLLSDHCLLAQELLHRLHSTESKIGYMAVKLDMEKAFDRIQWSFIRRVLHAFNFPPAWTNLIMECVTSPRYGLLINGEKTEWINASCGLRQGCPLSPYLFILCSEFLSILIKQSSYPGLGIKVCPSAQKISHLLFADDTLLFGSATTGTAKEMADILSVYCTLSGEAINAHKSNILFGPNVQQASKASILQLLGHKGAASLHYLGIKLRPGRSRSNDFDSILEQMSRKIRCWGTRHLSMAGRAALLKSSLAAIPLHLLANMPVPVSVLSKINSLLKNFLWSGTENRGSIHYTHWDNICLPKDKGGLGIKNMALWRNVCMARIAARILRKENSLLARTFRSKYGKLDFFIRKRSHSKIWKNICLGTDIMMRQTFWIIGTGFLVSLLDDTWLGPLPIAKWPTFIDVSSLPEHVAGLLNEDGQWDDNQLGPFGAELILSIKALPRLTGDDRLVWAHTEKEDMNAAAAYDAECPSSVHNGINCWKIPSLPRMQMHQWRASNALLPTNSWLCYHRLRNDALCPWGCGVEESVDHMLQGCRFFTKISLEAARLGLPPSLFDRNLLEFLDCEQQTRSEPETAGLLASIAYYIWKARNCHIHGEPFMQPATILIHALNDSSRGNWASTCNQQSTWMPPPVGWIKLNFDGSVMDNNVAGLGCAIRDHHGALLAALGIPHRSRSIAMTELHAAKAGIKLAAPLAADHRGIILEGDSYDACKSLNQVLSGCGTGNVESDLARLLPSFRRVEISLINRKANSVADHVAKNACFNEFLWDRGMPLPSPLAFLLLHDANFM